MELNHLLCQALVLQTRVAIPKATTWRNEESEGIEPPTHALTVHCSTSELTTLILCLDGWI